MILNFNSPRIDVMLPLSLLALVRKCGNLLWVDEDVMFTDVADFYGAASGGGEGGRHCLRRHTHADWKKHKPRTLHPHHTRDLGSYVPSHR